MSGIADIRVKKIPIILDKPRTLCYDLNALAALEDEFGDVDEALAALSPNAAKAAGKKPQTFKALRALLWAGLLHEVPEEELPAFTPRYVGTLITAESLPVLTEQIVRAVTQSMPEPKEGGNDTGNTAAQPGRKKAGTGPGSSI